MELDLTKDAALSTNLFLVKARQLVDLLFLPFDCLSDCLSFAVHCRLSPFSHKTKRTTYDLLFFSHTIEKGLSLPAPRAEFGRNNICRIVNLLRRADLSPESKTATRMALGCLSSYLEYHQERAITSAFLTTLDAELEKLRAKFADQGDGGVKSVAGVSAEIGCAGLSYPRFLESRFSCRSFAKRNVAQEMIQQVLETARSAPSQCNRQSARVHIFRNPAMIAALLGLQGGARGFGEFIPALAVVTNDLSSWISRGERNQGYVDSGLFAMATLYACHAHGLAACPLNFSKTSRAERRFRRHAGIPSSERIVMLIGIGYLDEGYAICARSLRSDVDEICTVHA